MFFMKTIKEILLSSKLLAGPSLYIRKFQKDICLYFSTSRRLKTFKDYHKKIIYYLGVPAHNNLGDQAQGVCIRTWLKKNFPNIPVIEIETNAMVNTRFSVLKKLKDTYKTGDLIIFQSGYTTTDLGGFADEMHRAVIDILPNANMVMMPQTIYFKSKENEIRTSNSYDSAKRLLFLARDKKSYEMAKNMFKNIKVDLYPDIVTTMIGKRKYDYDRNGILVCCRKDGEKYYSDAEIEHLCNVLETCYSVTVTDTTKDISADYMKKNAKSLLEREVEEYAKYRLIITDRYHGTILSLVAGTPVIVIKTTDHKVVTGVDWFRGVYDDYVYYADTLEEAYNLVVDIYGKKLDYRLNEYFDCVYYDKLAKYIQSTYF